ncbi:hypothetical protein CO610_03760 [Lysobacteraceae bacterium NML95-0200]|nr:hypothetical protein CO610_03760 [Xanthomonadaceae bacterium NML95-0200]
MSRKVTIISIFDSTGHRVLMRSVPLLVLLLLPGSPLQAQQSITIYRCVDAAGIVTLQNGKPCAKGQQQQARRMEVPAAPPPKAAPAAPVQAPAPAAPPPAEPPPAPAMVAKREPLPPPPLYRCRTWGGKNSYLNEDGHPPKRCDPLPVQGIDGSTANTGGIEACEMREDHCDRIPDEELCTAWSEYNRQAESMVRLENPDIAAKANALYHRTRQVMNTTTCADATAP